MSGKNIFRCKVQHRNQKLEISVLKPWNWFGTVPLIRTSLGSVPKWRNKHGFGSVPGKTSGSVPLLVRHPACTVLRVLQGPFKGPRWSKLFWSPPQWHAVLPVQRWRVKHPNQSINSKDRVVAQKKRGYLRSS